MESFWDYKVWGGLNLIIVLLLALIVANMIKRSVRWLEASLIPTSVLGGVLLLAVAGVYRAVTGELFFDTPFFGGNGMANLEIITYHTLALGFIAATFKGGKGKLTKKRTVEIFNTGVNTVSTYLLQAVVGFGITLIAARLVAGFFPAAGVLLPFGYGQGTGQALNYGGIYEAEFGFAGGKSFGLTVAAMGFLSASIGGVIHLNILKHKGKIRVAPKGEASISSEQVQGENEIPMQGSMDKLTVQMALIAGAYFLTYLMMLGLGKLLPGMRSVIYGFNFLLGVVAATLIHTVINFLQKKKVINRKYTNDFLMTRCSNFFYDIMVVAGIAAIRLGIVGRYWGILLTLGVVGLLITYFYNLLTARLIFKEYPEEQFLTMFGMLTGTASTGIILLREIDNGFETPAADNMVYQNFPAIVFGFPLMLLATLAPQKPILTWLILLLFFLMMNGLLFRSYFFKKRKKTK